MVFVCEGIDMETIAIIEDDEHIGNILEKNLQDEGYQTCRAYSGTEAKYLLREKKADLILLDLMLPGLTGEELLSEISDTPVIIVSAKVGIEDKVNMLLNGAVDYITKPFEMRELLARITVQLRKSKDSVKAVHESRELIAGELKLDIIARKVSVENMEIRLTRTEYAILKLLMQNKGQVLSKSAILDSICQDTPDCTDNSLKQHISNLRKKLRDAGGRDYIEAVWGIGFKLAQG